MSFKYALCSEVYKTPIDDIIRAAAEIGFDGIEIAPFNVANSVDDVSPERRAEIRQVADDAGISIVGLHWLLVAPKGMHLTTADDAVRATTSRYLQSLTHFCADLGGKVMILGSPMQRNVAEGEDHRVAFERAAAGLRDVGATCVERGVKLLIEALNPAETNFLQTIEDAIELRDAVDSPGVGFMLDCKAMSGMPAGIEGTIREHGAAAGHFHANEPSGKGPGMGDVDFGPILSALKGSGYGAAVDGDVWVSTEPFDYTPDSETVARTALETLRNAAG
jgi:sugar phosphate isomerase/epimerase